MQKLKIALAFFLVLLVGCAEELHLAINSIPEGAQVTSQNKFFGETPIDLTYEYRKSDFVKENVIKLPIFYFKWLSGAALTDTPYVNISKGKAFVLTYRRPENSPNLEADIMYGTAKERNRIEGDKAQTEKQMLNIETQRRLDEQIDRRKKQADENK
ncbi:MAG: hypothetical protein PHC61_04555 [Chitinivibrionales bacterium]|nr:hypothetical protein [Chitinivibrionales bacterium]